MTISDHSKVLVRLTASTVAGVTPSDVYTPHPAATQTILQYAFDQDATIVVQLQGPDGSFAEFDSIAYTSASGADVTSYQTNIGPFRVLVTPTATPVTGYVTGRYCGHAGGLA